tara:strand:- start:258 stop:560 length:303 start_codon:yes stop_codon:yes gene_type:complete
MTSAISASLSGLQSATQRLNVAAENTVKNSTFNTSQQVSGTQEISKSAQSGGPVRANFNPLPDFESSLVDLKLAEVSYKASAKALKVALELNKNLIDQIG